MNNYKLQQAMHLALLSTCLFIITMYMLFSVALDDPLWFYMIKLNDIPQLLLSCGCIFIGITLIRYVWLINKQ